MTGDQSRATLPLRVLIIEHDPVDVELELAELARAGFAVEYAVVGSPGELAALGDTRFDVVLADYRLPAWTGMEAFEALQARGVDAPFILVTGTMGEERAVDALKRGVTDYILKTNLARLGVAVRRALTERDTARLRARDEALIRQLTRAVDQSPASTFITDPAGRIEYVNQRFIDVTGYSREEAIGADPRLLASGETPHETYEALWRALRAGETWKGEIRNRRKDGTLYWDAVTISPLRDAQGTVTHFVSTQEDVTERRATLEKLRNREQRFRELAENIQEVFFVVRADLREMLYINPAYERVYGRPVQSLYDDPRSFVDAVVAEDRPALQAHIARVQAGEEAGALEFRIARPDGSERWLLSQAVPVRDEHGTVRRISGFALDITPRRAAEEALRASEQRLRTLFETLNLIVLVLDVDGRVEYMNRYTLELTGYTEREAIGADWFGTFLAPGDAPQLRRTFAELIAGEQRAHERNAILTRAGDRRLIAWHNTVLRDKHGRPTGTLSVGEDVTEHDRLEEQYRQAQKMEAVGRLAGGVAHDFNNLLTIIVSYAEMLKADLRPDDALQEAVEPILSAAAGATALSRQLLAFSRQQVIQPRVLALEEVVEQTLKLLRRVIGEDIALHVSLSEERNAVRIDPGQLEQVVMNLAVNARDAMPNGGSLTISTTRVELDAGYADGHWPTAAGTFAQVAVTDSGTGMDRATKARIFEPFFTTKEIGKGTGLGLATVYGIVKQSNGYVWVYSEPGIGTTFRIYLPLAEGMPGAVSRRPLDGGTLPRGSEVILLVEDSAGVREAARRVLEDCGYTVVAAPTAREAIDLAARRPGPIDLLLTDVVMPETSGPQLATEIGQVRPDARVLFMSGYADDSVLRHGILEPGVNYLQKPFTREELARKVRSVLDA